MIPGKNCIIVFNASLKQPIKLLDSFIYILKQACYMYFIKTLYVTICEKYEGI